jgi:hypothetical protein
MWLLGVELCGRMSSEGRQAKGQKQTGQILNIGRNKGIQLKSPLAAQAVVSLTLQNFMWTKKVAELIVFVANAIKNLVKSAGIKEIGLIDGHPEITNMALAKNF